MLYSPRIFLCFANDKIGQPLDALLPEVNALQKALRKYETKKWGQFFTAATSEPQSLLADLNSYTKDIIVFHFSGHNKGEKLQFVDKEGNPLAFKDSRLKAFLQAEENLKLVFLNACATKHHIKALQEAGIPAIVATKERVGDKKAKMFSENFYTSLVAGNSLEHAFDKACALLDTSKGEIGKYRGFIREDTDAKDSAWELWTSSEEMMDWTLKEEARRSGLEIKDTQALNSLPGPPMDFIGRHNELKDLERQLVNEKPVLLLNGLGGIGKTSLARKYLYENYHNFDRIAWVSVLSDQKEKESSFETATEALGNDVELFKSLEISFNIDETVEARAKHVF